MSRWRTFVGSIAALTAIAAFTLFTGTAFTQDGTQDPPPAADNGEPIDRAGEFSCRASVLRLQGEDGTAELEPFTAGAAEGEGEPPRASSPCEDEEAGLVQYEGPIGCEVPPDADCVTDDDHPSGLNPNEFLPNANSLGLLYARTEADPDDADPGAEGFQTEDPPDADETDDPDDPNDDAGVDHAHSRAGVENLFLTSGGEEDEPNANSVHISTANAFATVRCVPDEDGEGAHPEIDSRSQVAFVRLGPAAIDIVPGILPPDRTGPFEPNQEPGTTQDEAEEDGTNVHDHQSLGDAMLHFNHVHEDDIKDENGQVIGKRVTQQAVVLQRDATADPNSGDFDPEADQSALVIGEAVADYTGNPCEEKDRQGRITIIKDTEPDDPQDFFFNSNVEDAGGQFELDDDDQDDVPLQQEDPATDQQQPNKVSFDRPAGDDYFVTEEEAEGFQLEDIECEDPSGGTEEDEDARTARIDLAAGEEVICTFKNVREDEGQVTVVKDTQPDDPQDFRFRMRCKGDEDPNDDHDDNNNGHDDNGHNDNDDHNNNDDDNNNDDNNNDDEDDERCDERFELDDDGQPGEGEGRRNRDDDDLPNSRAFTVPSGEIRIRERQEDGFTTTAECKDDETGEVVADQDDHPNRVRFDLAPGQKVTCTFTNVKDQDEGQVKVVKDTQPDSEDEFAFRFRHDPKDEDAERTREEFTLQDNGDNEDGKPNSKTFSGLDAGEVRIREEEKDGFETNAVCTDDETGQQVEDEDDHPERVRFDLAEDQKVTCTFTNVREDEDEGQVKVVKDTQPDSGEEFGFRFRHDPDEEGERTRDEFTLSDGEHRTFSGLAPGEVRVREEEEDGFQTNAVCTDDATGQQVADEDDHPERVRFQLAEDQQVTCTFTNVREDEDENEGQVKVVKDTQPDSNREFDFRFRHDPEDGGERTRDEFKLRDGQSKTFDGLDAGETRVREEEEDGFTTNAVCVDDETGQQVADEDDHPERVRFQLAEDQKVTCTFTNTAEDDEPQPQTGRITVVKDTQPDDPQDFRFTGVEDGDGQFELDDDGVEGPPQQENDTDQQLPSRASFDRAPGDYTVTEGEVEGFELEEIDCEDPSDNTVEDEDNRTARINLSAGEEVICKFENEKEEAEEPEPQLGTGTIEIRKDIVDADKDDSPVFHFVGDLGEFDLSENEESGVPDRREFENIAPGRYEVTEEDDPQDGFELFRIRCQGDEDGDTPEQQGPIFDGGNTAVIDLDAGEDIRCRFLNTTDGNNPRDSGPGNDDREDDSSGSGSGGGSGNSGSGSRSRSAQLALFGQVVTLLR